MQAGSLRHRITFQLRETAVDDLRTPVEVWVDLFTCWAAFEPLSSRLFPANQKRNAETTARFRIRRREGIDATKHRIVFTINPRAETPIQSIWSIYPPLPVEGKLKELHVEAREVI